MRDLRILEPFTWKRSDLPPVERFGGAFEIPFPATGARLRVIATALDGWDHVSVSLKNRCPNWLEMSRIKDLFFEPHECAMQLHVPAEDHVNTHPYCLHLWRPHDVEIPRPPALMVGLKGMTFEQAKRLTTGERLALQDIAERALLGRSVEATR